MGASKNDFTKMRDGGWYGITDSYITYQNDGIIYDNYK